MTWTQERTERLKTLAALRWSASRIADDLGEITRSAVINKARREGFPMKAERPSYAPRPVPSTPPLNRGALRNGAR